MKNTLPLLFLLFLLACRKERITTDAAVRLTIGTDTLRFDTVFTTTGSVTQAFKIFNDYRQGIRIATIRLAGGATSAFQINANGIGGPTIENLELAPKDSAYVFVTVRVNPTAATLPFLVQDSIELEYNGNKKRIQLEAYGQNAHFLRKHKITQDETWNNDLPYVLLDTLLVERHAHLTINEGCRIYLHAGTPVVVAGRLTVQGKRWDSTRVHFTSDRLDAPYRELPGSWPGIVFKASSHDNNLHYAVLKNAAQAIVVEASPLANKLHLSQTIIDHASDAGLLADHTSITAQNLLISNCGKGIVLRNGGNYQFTHATVASFPTAWLPHKAPVLLVSNMGPDNSTNALNAVFRNCIFWGESGGVVREEVAVANGGNAAFNLLFDGVLWPQAASPDGATVPLPPLTAYPQFESIDAGNKIYDFHLKETSPARNSGVPSDVSLDLDGRPRPAGAPDLGAYENQ